MLFSRLLLPAAVAAVLTTTAAAAFAQTPQMPSSAPSQGSLTAGRPFRGTFGGGVDGREQTITFTGSLGAGFESSYLTVPAGSEDVADPGGGGMGAGSATLSYALGRPRASLNASVNASTFYYDRSDQSLVPSYRASGSQSLQIGRQTRLTANQYVARQQFRLDRLFPGATDFTFGAPPTLPGDQYSGVDDNLDMGANVDVGQQLSSNVWMNAGYSAQSNQWGTSSRRTLQGGRIGIGVGVARGLSLRFGYGFYQSRYHDSEPRTVDNHNIDVGVDYSGAISLSRRTTLSFSTGSTAFGDREETHVRVVGRAELRREIGRTWVAVAEYFRDAYYVNEFSEITFSDSGVFSVGGLLNRRVSFHSGVGLSMGDVGFSAGGTNTHAAYAVSGVTTALSRFTAIGLDYNYYMHFFGDDVSLPEGVLREANRHAIRAYLTVWAPLMARERSRNASR